MTHSRKATIRDNGDESDPANGKMTQAIVLKDDLGKSHKLSGQLKVSQVYMVAAPGASYAYPSLAGAGEAIPFHLPAGADIANTAISASNSGVGYGLQILSYGQRHSYSSTPLSCTYAGSTEHICRTDRWGRERCFDQTVSTDGPCTQGGTETQSQGIEVTFGITNAAGKVVGRFVLIR